MKHEEKRKFGISLIVLGLLSVIHWRLMAIGLIVLGLMHIDNFYNQFIEWIKKTFNRNYDPNEGWYELDKEGKIKDGKSKKV